jgi:hypothetical protein
VSRVPGKRYKLKGAAAANRAKWFFKNHARRRHMNKGQRAMVAAKICLLNKQPQRETATQTGLNAAYIAQASVVLEYAPELAARPVHAPGEELAALRKCLKLKRADKNSDPLKFGIAAVPAKRSANAVAGHKLAAGGFNRNFPRPWDNFPKVGAVGNQGLGNLPRAVSKRQRVAVSNRPFGGA